MKIEEIKYEDPYLEKMYKIKELILNNDVHNVVRAMPAVGMQEDCNNEALELIDLCLRNEAVWIRRAGYLCLYHFYVRYRERMCTIQAINFWRNGLTDHNEVVSSIVNDTLDEIKEFSPLIYQQIVDGNKNTF